ncbi:PLP-dependent aminotransferase family protein [Roseobacter sp. N2S]|uniref:MocR-like ectoine utilization transcription factor EhuR n=1 Tax=Roseobacter sp. N2S TaxID=2663844 RepID=UPI002861E70E|nr:PLP-dependent aminotransferase family protein [Roseobacter sp. N2S]MDR6265751.1 DNA-binding transcriptional MocR family regulator [Roseobacter sp. N2S]
MTNWPPDPETITRPAYRSLIQAIEAAIQSNALKPGDQLPPHRKLAFDLNLSVQTVSRAYDKLTEAGKIVGEVGRGTFVRAASDDVSVPFVSRKTAGQVLDMSILKPVIDHAHEVAMQKVLRAMARSVSGTVLGGSRPDHLLDGEISAEQRWLGLCGLDVPHSNVIVTNGSTSAMTVALMTAAQSGDLIVAEDVGHHTLRSLAQFLGMRLRGVAVDQNGICPDTLEDLCQKDQVKVLYLMPSGTNPLGFTMSEQRRAKVVDIARRYDLLIVENHAWGPLLDGPPPMASLAPERVLFFTSLTKCILPGLRVGYLVVPDHLALAAASRHLVTNWMATNLMTEIAIRWIEDGTAEMLLNRQRLALADRAEFARNLLKGLDYRLGPNGFHIWLYCRDAEEERKLVNSARQMGVAVAPGASFSIGPHDRHTGIRIALGGLSFPDFAQGLRVIDRLARSGKY